MKGFLLLFFVTSLIGCSATKPVKTMRHYGFQYRESTKVYVEDLYKYVIFSDSIEDYDRFLSYLKNELKKIPDVELVNPSWQEVRDWNFLSAEAKARRDANPYPFLEPRDDYDPKRTVNSSDLTLLFAVPTATGKMNELDMESNLYHETAKAWQVAFFVRRKDGMRFRRFNDENLHKIQSIPGTASAAVLYFGDSRMKPLLNIKVADSSKRYFPPRYEPWQQNSLTEFSDHFDMEFVFFKEMIVIDLSQDVRPINRIRLDGKILRNVQKGTGLGILDIYEELSRKYQFTTALDLLDEPILEKRYYGTGINW